MQHLFVLLALTFLICFTLIQLTTINVSAHGGEAPLIAFFALAPNRCIIPDPSHTLLVPKVFARDETRSYIIILFIQ